MKLFYWITFSFLLGISLGFTPNNSEASEKFKYTKMRSLVGKKLTKKVTPKKIIQMPIEDEIDGSGVKVLVIKKAEIKSLVDSIEKNYRAYTGLNRYEKINEVSSGVKQGRLKKTTQDFEPAIALGDKPLVLGGNGFGVSGFEPAIQGLHFSFNSHMEDSPVNKINKENISGYLAYDFEKSKSEKFLIFHNSSLIFGREPDVLVDPKPKQFTRQEEIFETTEPILETGVYFDQNKKVIVHLNPAEKPLDLIRDNSALLRHDYQALISSDPSK